MISSGFSLIEALVVIAIIGILAGFTISYLSEARDEARLGRVQTELRELANAVHTYYAQHREYPPDVGPPLMYPSELEPYISGTIKPPFQKSFYDYENWDTDGDGKYDIIQISLRLCDPDNTSDCEFLDTPWTENFTSVSNAVFYCIEGPCRSMSSQPRSYPGYCINCACKQMGDPACGY